MAKTKTAPFTVFFKVNNEEHKANGKTIVEAVERVFKKAPTKLNTLGFVHVRDNATGKDSYPVRLIVNKMQLIRDKEFYRTTLAKKLTVLL